MTYKQNKMLKSTMTSSGISPGERLETKIERMVTENEPITSEVPLMYSERKEGVNPDFDIRTDKWDRAAEAMSSIEKSIIVRKDAIAKKEEIEKEAKAKENPAEPGQ